ncbi:hypothetical protein ACXZ66_13210 [Corynebacterium sp. S7]
MLSLTTILGIISIFISFALFGTAFYLAMKKKSWKVWVPVIVIAFLFMTVIPVSLAVFVAVPEGSAG